MGFRRKFYGEPVARLIVSVPVEIVEEIDELIGQRPEARATKQIGGNFGGNFSLLKILPIGLQCFQRTV